MDRAAEEKAEVKSLEKEQLWAEEPQRNRGWGGRWNIWRVYPVAAQGETGRSHKNGFLCQSSISQSNQSFANFLGSLSLLPTLGFDHLYPDNSFFFLICSEFCHTLKWNSHGFTCVPHPDSSSHLPLHPLPLGLPSAPDNSFHHSPSFHFSTQILPTHLSALWVFYFQSTYLITLLFLSHTWHLVAK